MHTIKLAALIVVALSYGFIALVCLIHSYYGRKSGKDAEVYDPTVAIWQ